MRHVAFFLFLLGLVAMQVLVGGAGLVHALPAGLLLAGAALLLVFVRKKKAGHRLTVWTGAATVLLAGYVIGRCFFSPVEYLARWDLFLTLGAALGYFMMTEYFVRSRERLLLVAVLGVLALVHVVIGAVQFKQQDNFMLIPWFIRSDWEWRASGFYIYPNHLAGLLEMVCFLTLSICCWGRVPNWVRIMGGYCALMCLVGVALTGSRGGYLSVLCGLIVFGGCSLWAVGRVRPDRRAVVSLATVGGIALLVGGALFFMVKSASIAERVNTVYEPNNVRLSMWKSALQQWPLSPVVGTGSGTFAYYGREFRTRGNQRDPLFVHNDYLHLLAEYGVIGAVLGLGFIGLHVYSGSRGMKKIVNERLKAEWRTSSNELALTLGALCGTAALLFHSVLDFNFHLPANALVGAILFAILATPSTDAESSAEKSPRRLAWAPGLAPGVGLAMVVLGAPLVAGEYYGDLARRALRDRNYNQARTLAERAITLERRNPNLYFYLGEACHFLTKDMDSPVGRAGLFESAAEAYQEGLRLFPRDTRLLLVLGRTLDLAGRFAEADEIFQRAIAGDPNFGNVYAYYGMHFKLQRRWAEAEIYLRKAAALSEADISPAALAEIEQFKNSDLGKKLLPPAPEVPPPAEQ